MTDPMKQILSIYETCRNTYAIAHLDDFAPPQCESLLHKYDLAVHSGLAAFFVTTICHHRDGYLCAPVTEWLKVNGQRDCECGQTQRPSDLTFIPIGGQS